MLTRPRDGAGRTYNCSRPCSHSREVPLPYGPFGFPRLRSGQVAQDKRGSEMVSCVPISFWLRKAMNHWPLLVSNSLKI